MRHGLSYTQGHELSYPSHFVGWYMVCPMPRNCTRFAHGASLFIRCYAINPANKGYRWQRREGLFRGSSALYGPWWRGMEGSGAKGRGGWGRGAGRQGRGGTPWCTWGAGGEMMGRRGPVMAARSGPLLQPHRSRDAHCGPTPPVHPPPSRWRPYRYPVEHPISKIFYKK